MTLFLDHDVHPLRENGLFIGGEWIARSVSGRSFDVRNPATGAVVATLPDGGAPETEEAIERAVEAQRSWGTTTGPYRARILERAFELMEEHADGLARIVTQEQGKPLAEAIAEVGYGSSFLHWFAGEAERIYGRTVPASQENKRILVIRNPVGVTGAITPWNFPVAMVTRKVAPALAAGCTVVLKPSELTPLSALAVASLLKEAGLPNGVLSVVCGLDAAAIGDVMLDDGRVRKITFTGSTRVGKSLIRRSADSVKRVSMELGGQAPFIVFADADLEAAADGLLAAKMRNTGQSCIAANRVFVERAVEREFTRMIADRMGRLRVGNGLDDAVDVGPLINAAALDKVERHVRDAVDRGAELVLGSSRLREAFFEPTVIAGVDDGMLVAREETFGPLAAVLPFDTEDEVVARANGTEYGLAAYYYTRDVGRVMRLADRLEFGIQGVNDGFVSVAQAPFGGLKHSGLGREGGSEGIEEFLETKYLSLAV